MVIKKYPSIFSSQAAIFYLLRIGSCVLPPKPRSIASEHKVASQSVKNRLFQKKRQSFFIGETDKPYHNFQIFFVAFRKPMKLLEVTCTDDCPHWRLPMFRLKKKSIFKLSPDIFQPAHPTGLHQQQYHHR